MRFSDKHLTVYVNPVPCTVFELLVMHGVSANVPNPPTLLVLSLFLRLCPHKDYANPNSNRGENISRITLGGFPKQQTSNAKDHQWKNKITDNEHSG